MARITLDPVTRIEGHLRIDVEVNGGAVTNAWSSAQMWRGIETILQGRPPEDASSRARSMASRSSAPKRHGNSSRGNANNWPMRTMLNSCKSGTMASDNRKASTGNGRNASAFWPGGTIRLGSPTSAAPLFSSASITVGRPTLSMLMTGRQRLLPPISRTGTGTTRR